jgi:hypothetical protein
MKTQSAQGNLETFMPLLYQLLQTKQMDKMQAEKDVSFKSDRGGFFNGLSV